MTHERQQTLCLIQMFLRDVTEQEKQNKQSVVHLQEFSSKDWALDKVCYTYMFSYFTLTRNKNIF